MEALHLLFQTSCCAISSIIFSRNFLLLFLFFFFLSKSFSIALFNSLHVLLYFSLTFCLTFQFLLSLLITPFVPLQPSHILPFKKKKVFSLFLFFPFSFSLLVDFLKLHLLFFHLWFFFFVIVLKIVASNLHTLWYSVIKIL